jgi:Ras-related protein Rab-8A
MQYEKLSLKDGDSVQDLLSKIYKAVNESNKDLPINRVNVSQIKNPKLQNCESSISLILIGDTHVGKTNFLTRYMDNKFHEVFISTVGIEREIKGVKIDNKIYKLTIWDTAGQERFKSLPIKYYKNVDGVLLLYDVSDENSFTDVQSWLNDVKQNSNRTADSDISLFLLANKIDKEDRKISREKGEELAKSLGMKYFEISCKNNINVHETMARMIMECYKRVSNTSNTSKNIQLSNQKGGKTGGKGGCCDKKKNK